LHSSLPYPWSDCAAWRGTAEAFGGAGAAAEPVNLDPLHAKIGQLTLENDFLERALTKAGLLSAKR
jgi:transposase